MKHKLFLFTFLLAILSAINIQASERKKYNFNSEWKLRIGDFPKAKDTKFDDSKWKQVTLPHAFNEDEAFKLSIEQLTDTVVWYRKSFQIPELKSNQKVFVEFEGVRQRGDFYLNGHYLGRHENGVMAVGFDLTPHIKEGENVIAVRTDNDWMYREEGTNSKFQWNDRNFNANYGGIPKNVFLYVTDNVYQTLPLYSNLKTTGVYVYAQDFDIQGRKATIHAESEVRNDSKAPRQFSYQVSVLDADGKLMKTFQGDKVTLKANPDNVKDFYETGMSYINNVSVAGGGEKADFRLSFTSTNQTGVVPGSDYNKYAFSVNAGMNFTKNFTGRISAQYIRSDSEGRPAQGANDSNLLIPLINGLPRTIDIHDIQKNWVDENGKQITLDPEGKSNNPYWIINKNKFTNNLDRMIGNITLTYKPIEGLTITNNAGTDFYTEGRRKVYAKGTVGALNGKFQTWNLYKRIINNDLMVSYEKTFANDYHFKVMMGHNLYQEEWKNENVQAQNLVVDGLYTYTNAKSTTPVNYYEKKRLVGLYGDISLGYKDMLFVNVTGRNDWSSTLPINNRSYFYPSISGSFIFTELMENKDILNFGKVRLSYANVGSDEDPYNLAFKYTPASTYFLQYLGNVNTFPHMGLVGFTGPRVLPNENLKPQNQSSFEVGADLRFFGGKIRLDMTYYSNITKNQIVSIDVPLSTGYFANNINAGKIANKGVEVTLGLTPVETRDFKWDLDATFASNKQTVEELAEGLDEYTLTSGLSGLQIKAAKGDSFGLYGTGWKRDDQGNYVINSKTGLRETVNNVRLGDVYPDFTMGINNTFTYKGVTLSFLIDIRHGGSLYSETVANLRSSGLAAETIAHREDASFIEPGVILQDDGTYRPNDVPVKSMQDYWQHISNSSNNEGNIYNASFVKLREVQLSYSFPRKWFKSFFVKSLDLGFEARNLWIIKDHVPHIDPEANFFGPSQIGGGVEFNSIPSTRSFGFNVRLTL